MVKVHGESGVIINKETTAHLRRNTLSIKQGFNDV